MPTAEQLNKVKENVANLIDFTNHVHPFFSDKVSEVYLNLKANQESDPGQTFLCTLFDAAFWSIGSLEFAGAGVFSSFLGSFFGAYVGPNPPPNLEKTFAGVVERLDATLSQALDDLAAIHENPAAYWDKTYANPLNHKTIAISSLGDASASFPSRYTPLFQRVTDTTVFQFRQELTKAVLPTVYYVYFSDYYSSWQYQNKEAFFRDASDYIAKYPAYFFKYRETWKFRGGQKADVIQYFNFSLVMEGSITTVAPDDLCQWLFEDDGYGHQTNADGVAKRRDVFFSWGLREYFPSGKPFGLDQAVATLSVSAAGGSERSELDDSHLPDGGPKPLPIPSANRAG
ncbi:hypothetical protein AB4851_13535 [Burkholderia sp. 22PA0099]|uniref:hypothetical protein n=1 Tax=Burkholderia sp. 22PA0099 TaxID=3237372 RepID=UPI0039C45AAB